jgi:pimeloyl-ACP methyl ester carboxylesterase
LDGWSIIDRLTLIKPKTLVINGHWDISQDFVIQPLVHLIPRAKRIKFDNSSHMPFWEERDKYFRKVAKFLKN